MEEFFNFILHFDPCILYLYLMIKVDEALRIILNSIQALDSDTISLANASGRVLQQDIFSNSDIPAFDNSGRDGYALRSADTKDASPESPCKLEVLEELKAGMMSSSEIKSGQAVKIMTGAPIPEGADSVIMVEDTEKSQGTSHKPQVRIFKETTPGENIRRAGEDIKKGELVIQKGTLLKAAHAGMLAALGITKAAVTRKPRIAILATGDELVDADEEAPKGKVRTSNTYALYSQILSYSGIPVNIGIARDEPKDIREKIESALVCDLILTSGGVSMGDYDLVKDVLTKMGADIKFWKIAMRPGKPILFSTLGEKPVFGLPGNPVSSMVGFELFVRPAILKMLGQTSDDRQEAEAFLEEDIEKKKGLRYFLRAQTRWEDGGYLTKTTGPQGSGILKSMMLANSFIILPEEEEFIKKGAKVRVRFLN
jgi:molybdopterin molybdotransferase